MPRTRRRASLAALTTVGRGFADQIAAERKPVILDRVDHTTVLNPVLLDKGIRSLIGVPMTVGRQVIGVLHVGSLSSRTFTVHDAVLSPRCSRLPPARIG